MDFKVEQTWSTNGWKCAALGGEGEMWEKKNKGTPGEGMSGCRWVRSRDASMAALRGESWRGKQRSVGVWGAGMWWVMPRSDLISVFWLTGWEQREVGALLTATHSALCQIWTVNQQADRLGYPIRHFPLPFPSIHELPSSLHLSWAASHVKSLTEFNYTCCPCSTQTSAPPTAGSWPGEGQQPPGNWFMWRLLVHSLTRVLLSIAVLFSLSVFPLHFKGFGFFWHRHEVNWQKKKKKKRWNTGCVDEIKKCQRACKIIWP